MADRALLVGPFFKTVCQSLALYQVVSSCPFLYLPTLTYPDFSERRSAEPIELASTLASRYLSGAPPGV